MRDALVVMSLLLLAACAAQGANGPDAEEKAAWDIEEDSPIGGAILALANRGSAEDLLGAGVDSAEAYYVPSYRAGQDGTPDTGDDEAFECLEEVTGVLGRLNFDRMVRWAESGKRLPTEERCDEGALIKPMDTPMGGRVLSMALAGNTAYVAVDYAHADDSVTAYHLGGQGPSLIASYAPASSIRDFAARDGRGYILHEGGVDIIDLGTMQLLGGLSAEYIFTKHIAVDANRRVYVTRASMVDVIDASNPTSPQRNPQSYLVQGPVGVGIEDMTTDGEHVVLSIDDHTTGGWIEEWTLDADGSVPQAARRVGAVGRGLLFPQGDRTLILHSHHSSPQRVSSLVRGTGGLGVEFVIPRSGGSNQGAVAMEGGRVYIAEHDGIHRWDVSTASPEHLGKARWSTRYLLLQMGGFVARGGRLFTAFQTIGGHDGKFRMGQLCDAPVSRELTDHSGLCH